MPLEFNRLDRFISYQRLNKIKRYVKPFGAACDLGCGDGDLLAKLNNELKFQYCVGIDRDIESRESGNMKFIKGDVVAGLLLPDDFFDTVLVLAVIEHIEPEKANNFLMEAKRILKKGGRLIITSPTPSSKPILEFLVFKLKIANKEAVADHKHYYALNEMRNLLKNAGFHEIESGYFEFFLNAFYIFKK